ncbi:MAG TPA: DUF202 domain-containing protein [Mycobacterium sp.]|nr:DUF202 domain-containing protein [Mycobacterium sp.]
MADDAGAKPGLQTERTQLAWERTAFGYLAVTAVLLFHTDGPVSHSRAVLAWLSIALSLTVVLIGRWRGRTAGTPGADARPRVRSPAVAVGVTGWATAGLALLILLAAVLPGL